MSGYPTGLTTSATAVLLMLYSMPYFLDTEHTKVNPPYEQWNDHLVAALESLRMTDYLTGTFEPTDKGRALAEGIMRVNVRYEPFMASK